MIVLSVKSVHSRTCEDVKSSRCNDCSVIQKCRVKAMYPWFLPVQFILCV